MKYVPRLNDYVSWRNVEGWVYFVTDEYLTIEISVKPKEDDLVPMHRKHHCLVVCYAHCWDELEYVNSRRHASASNLDDMETYNRFDTYKSQEHRYQDP